MHSQCFVTPFSRTETYLHSFLPSTITLWNFLSSSLVELEDSDEFKDDLYSHHLPTNCVCMCYTLSCEFYTVKTINNNFKDRCTLIEQSVNSLIEQSHIYSNRTLMQIYNMKTSPFHA